MPRSLPRVQRIPWKARREFTHVVWKALFIPPVIGKGKRLDRTVKCTTHPPPPDGKVSLINLLSLVGMRDAFAQNRRAHTALPITALPTRYITEYGIQLPETFPLDRGPRAVSGTFKPLVSIKAEPDLLVEKGPQGLQKAAYTQSVRQFQAVVNCRQSQAEELVHGMAEFLDTVDDLSVLLHKMHTIPVTWVDGVGEPAQPHCQANKKYHQVLLLLLLSCKLQRSHPKVFLSMLATTSAGKGPLKTISP